MERIHISEPQDLRKFRRKWIYLIGKFNKNYRWLIKPKEIWDTKKFGLFDVGTVWNVSHDSLCLFKFEGEDAEKYPPGQINKLTTEFGSIMWTNFKIYLINDKEFKKFKEEAFMLKL